jgi:hypothetical protein
LAVSLFPFLSILCCVIGTLILILAGLATVARGETDPLAEEFARLVAETEAAQKESERLERLCVRATDLQDKLSSARDRLGRRQKYVQLVRELEDGRTQCTGTEYLIAQASALAQKLEMAKAELDKWEQSREEAASNERQQIDLLSRLTELRQKLADLKKTVALTRDEIAKIVKTPEAQLPEHYVLRPSGTGKGLVPHFVECVSNGIWIHPDQPKPARKFVGSDDIPKSQAFQGFLNAVKGQSTATLTLLVREGGAKAFDAAYSEAKEKKVRHGFLAVPGKLPIDFSLINQLKA